MTQDNKDLKKMLDGILAKKRNCIPLTAEEQKWADETYGKLFDKKFGNRTFVVKTGEEIRKGYGKPTDVQPEEAIADERSKFNEKDDKIEDDYSSGTIKETEDGDNVNVDEKDADEAKNVNASDIINADNDNMQRKPTLKFDLGDPVVKVINNRPYVGIIVGTYPDKEMAMVKWAVGTFSYVNFSDLEKVADKYPKEQAQEPPVSADQTEGTETPGTDVADENVGLKPKETKDKVIKNDDHDEEDETPEDEAAETPAEQAKEEAEGTEEHDKPTDEELADNEWHDKCMKAVGMNPNAENPGAICRFVRTTMKKSNEKIVKVDIEEIRKSNPKLAEQMEKDGHKHLQFDIEKFEKSEN